MKGRFISFEGIDGAGKTTQINILLQHLKETGVEVLLTREPGGTPEAEALRDLLLENRLSGKTGNWLPKTEAMLMYAARYEHVQKVILPALEKGIWVLCDRFSDSTKVYQGYGDGICQSWLQMIHEAVLKNFEPDLSFIFNLNIALSKQRLQQRETKVSHYETKNFEFQKRIQEGFLEVLKRNPKRCVYIDATKKIQEISSQIWKVITDRYTLRV